jgi:signal transduction histidine kinase
MQREKIKKTATVSAILVCVALALDWIVNDLFGLGAFTPITTMTISGLISVPACYYFVSQRLDLQRARDELAATLRARDAAEAASAAKTAFLGAMSHELRTPLNAIIGYTEIMMEGAEEERREGDLADHGRVLNASQGLLRLITDVLEFSKLESGEAAVAAAPFDPAAIAREAAAAAAPGAKAAGNVLTLHMADNLGGGVGDGAKIGQCLGVLLGNAAKFTHGGDIKLTVWREGEGAYAAFAFEVSDTGCGIAPEHQARLFEPFTQADGSMTRAHDGAGLGLALAARLARLMGGTISVKSAPGAGSAFTLRVPARLEAAAPEAIAA